jgi:Zn-dependent protease with chaperone function
MWKRFAVLAVALSMCISVAAADAEFEARLERELAAKDAQALSLWKRANAAREADRVAEALTLYAMVHERVPSFDHALRRLASMELAAGRTADAVLHARQAIELQRSPENMSTLAYALLQHDTGREEAVALAREAVKAKPDDEFMWEAFGAAAFKTNDIELLREAAVRLESLAPKSPNTHVYRATLAVNDSDWTEARAALDRARAVGLPQNNYDELMAWVRSTEPFYLRWWKPALFALAAWFAGFGLMLLTGAVLSWMAMRAAETTDGLSAKVRRLYAIVLGAACAFYYASVPIVIAFVLALSGGLVYATFALGRIPIKLVILVVVVAGVTMWSMLKSLFIRARDVEPGMRLDLAAEPRLRAVLDAVAAKIGTRAVDNVYLTPGTEVAVMERGKGRQKERCLILGLAALDGLRVRPFKAILGHEYGHFTNRDTAGGAFALAVRNSLMLTAVGLAEGGAAAWYNPAWLFVNAFHRVFLRISEGASRLQEVLADRWAVFAYGADAFEEGLRHVVERDIRFDVHVTSTINEVLERKVPLANLYTYKAAPVGEDVQEAIEQALNRRSSAYDSHPAPAERFTLIRKLPPHAIEREADDDAPSQSLFSNFEALQVRMTAQVRENVRANAGLEILAPA